MDICVVTGGGSGMGLETAKIVGKTGQHVILVGRTVKKLDGALQELKGEGVDAEAFPGDVSDRDSVEKLAKYAAGKGNIRTVINAAGITGGQAPADKIFTIDAMGPIYIGEAFGPLMGKDSCILHVASMAGHMLPADQVPEEIYRKSLTDPDEFLKEMLQQIDAIPEDQNPSGAAYVLAKYFVRWITVRQAVKFGKQGVRVISISPGTFLTPMGKMGGREAASYAEMGALGRVGDPIEIARVMAYLVSSECSYMTGTDLLYDGGTIAAMKTAGDAK